MSYVLNIISIATFLQNWCGVNLSSLLQTKYQNIRKVFTSLNAKKKANTRSAHRAPFLLLRRYWVSSVSCPPSASYILNIISIACFPQNWCSVNLSSLLQTKYQKIRKVFTSLNAKKKKQHPKCPPCCLPWVLITKWTRPPRNEDPTGTCPLVCPYQNGFIKTTNPRWNIILVHI